METNFAYAMIKENDVHNVNRQRLRWLDRWMMYFICVPRGPNGQIRSRRCRICSILWRIFLTLLLAGGIAYYISELLQSEPQAVMIAKAVLSGVTVILLILCAKYYHTYFRYFWHSKGLEESIDVRYNLKGVVP